MSHCFKWSFAECALHVTGRKRNNSKNNSHVIRRNFGALQTTSIWREDRQSCHFKTIRRVERMSSSSFGGGTLPCDWIHALGRAHTATACLGCPRSADLLRVPDVRLFQTEDCKICLVNLVLYFLSKHRYLLFEHCFLRPHAYCLLSSRSRTSFLVS